MKILKKCQTIFKHVIILFVTLYSVNAYAAGGAPDPDPKGPENNGLSSFWSYAGKTGIGTSYERYHQKGYSSSGPTGPISKVWFSIAQGIVTEVAYGLIHEGQIRDLQFLVTGPETGFWLTGSKFMDEEKIDTTHAIEYLHTDSAGRPLSLSYRVINTDKQGKYQIEKHIFTDPDRQTLFMRVKFTANSNNITPYILINPHMNNTGNGDVAYVGTDSLNAREGDKIYLCLKSTASFVKTSAGFVGYSDGYKDLEDNRVMDWEYDWADSGGGNVAAMAKLETLNAGDINIFDIAIGFGHTHDEAVGNADGSLSEGYSAILDKYNGVGAAIGWEDYINSLTHLPSMVPFTGDNGGELYASALLLKAQEDKTHAGALIASLSIPWGDSRNADAYETGYRAVWPRDFYQCAMALLALGDIETPLVAFEFLDKIQVKPGSYGNSGVAGWFLQKTHVDSDSEWVNVQMDQTAMPIMLAWKLWKAGLITNNQIQAWYGKMLKPAAEFLANGGYVNFGANGQAAVYSVYPPETKQERWEEEEKLSPSTNAAIIAGLIAAADIARNIGGGEIGAAKHYEKRADGFVAKLKSTMFTSTGPLGNGNYFLRINDNENPNDGHTVSINNGGPSIDERLVLDGGFLELVRYGVLPANDPAIVDSLVELDDMSRSDDGRVKYEFTFGGNTYPAWRRYSYDHYGERKNDGSNYKGDNSDNRGRPWPFLTGERGHYELEKVKADNGGMISATQVMALRDIYVRAMEYYANEGLMLPEQIWDGVGSNTMHQFKPGEGTNSATPLAWAHAEYVKLVKSLSISNTWDSYSIVRSRYSQEMVEVTFECQNGQTYWGQNIYVVGSLPQLGDWDPEEALKLEPSSYPVWSKKFALPASISFEWKCIKKEPLVWQPDPNNSYTTPASGFSQTTGTF